MSSTRKYRYLSDVLHTFPAAGTSDVQRLRLAGMAFGTYREAWSSRLRERVRLESVRSGPEGRSAPVAPTGKLAAVG